MVDLLRDTVIKYEKITFLKPYCITASHRIYLVYLCWSLLSST